MAKRTTSFELMLPARDPGTPAYRWLCTALRAEILEGRLRPGARLPATRDLAEPYGLSRGTIVNAFEQLKSEGYVEGSVGSGTYVSKILPDDAAPGPRKARAPRPRVATANGAAPLGLRAAGAAVSGPVTIRARPAPSAPTSRRWTSSPPRSGRRSRPAVCGGSRPTSCWGCDPLGYRPLQEAVADYLSTSRGVKCAPGAGRDRLRGARGARSGGAALPESRRPGVHGGAGICGCGAGVRGHAGRRSPRCRWTARAWSCASRGCAERGWST